MATANPLEDILNSDVDPNAISALVGSLESQLASPTIKDPSQLNSVSSVTRNHVHTQAIDTHVNSTDKTNLTISNLGLKTSLHQSNHTISQSNTNGGSQIVNSQHLLTLPNSVTLPVSASTVSSGLLSTANNLQTQPNKTAMTIATSVPNANYKPSSTILLNSETIQGKQVNVSVSVGGSEAVLVRTSQNGGIISRVQSGSVNVLSATTVTPSATAPGNSAIHKLATVAAEQKPMSIVNHTSGITEQKPTVNAVPVGSMQHQIQQQQQQRPQFVIKSEVGSTGRPVMAQPVSSPHVTAALKNNPANSSVITLNNPHTVTVVRPAVTTTQPQIQIVNVPNSVNPRLQGVSTNTKPLAPRMVQQAQPVRIAPQQQPQPTQVTSAAQATRPQSAGNVGTITLPPGFQLPPGAMIVKNEQGQFMVVNAGASGTMPSSTATSSSSSTAPQPKIAHHTLRPGTVTMTQTQRSMQVQQQQHQQHRVAPVRQQQQQVVRGPMGITQQQQQQHRPVSAAATHVPRPQVQPRGATLHPQQGTSSSVQVSSATNQGTLENVKKCKNFLSTLIKLAASQPQSTVKNVKTLIQGLIDGTVEPEEFTHKLQIELKSSPQPYLVPFLKKSLPLLRQSMMANKFHIEGVRAPVAAAASATTTLSGVKATTTAGASGASRHQASSTTHQVTSRTPPITSSPARRLTVTSSIPASTSSPASSTAGRQLTPNQMLLYQQQQLIRQQQLQQQQQGGATVTKNLLSKPPQRPGLLNRPNLSSLATASQPVSKDKRKYDQAALKEDDDINDVATMGGVNLTEESRNILGSSSDLMSTQLRTCKDTNFLYTKPLLERINAIAKKHGLDECPTEVVNLISHATEERLRNLAEKLANVAEHRIELYKLDNRYTAGSEVRSKLKFLEELDKLEKKRHEDAEREVLLRVARSRAKNEDPEQLKLKEKAKALQAMEMEEMRQKEANLTALAAIGPRKKRKLDDTAGSPGGSSGTGGASSSGSSSAAGANSRGGAGAVRPRRIKRVTLRDVLFILEQEREARHSPLLYKAYTK